MKSFVERVRENNAKGEKTMVDVFAWYKTKKIRKWFGDGEIDLDWKKKKKEADLNISEREVIDGKVYVDGLWYVMA